MLDQAPGFPLTFFSQQENTNLAELLSPTILCVCSHPEEGFCLRAEGPPSTAKVHPCA